MAPGTNVGAATPVGLDGATGSDKAVNDAAAYIRSIAERYGRDADLAESFVRDATSISADDAAEAGLIDVIAPTSQDLLAQLDGQDVQLGDGSTVTLSTDDWVLTDEPMGSLVAFLHGLVDPTLAFIFFWLGLALIVLELLVPGHVFSGSVGTLLLIVSIVSFGLLPVQAVGIILLIAAVRADGGRTERPWVRGVGVRGIGVLGLGRLVPVRPRRVGSPSRRWRSRSSRSGSGLFFTFVVAKVIRMRHMAPAQGAEAIVGMEGVAISGGLHPDGVVRVASEEWRAVTGDGHPVANGTPVRVTKLDGLVLTVDAIAAEHEPAGTAPAEEGRNI